MLILHLFFSSSHMWLKYKWFDGLICADTIILPHVTSQQNYVSSWLPNLLLQSFPIMSRSQFIFFSLFSMLILPWGCSCANCVLHLRVQPKVSTLSTIKPSMPLPSMESAPYLTFNFVFKELFYGPRYVSLLFQTEEGSVWPSSEQVCGVFCFLVHCVSRLPVIYPFGYCCLVKEAGIKCTQEKEEKAYKFLKVTHTRASKADSGFMWCLCSRQW